MVPNKEKLAENKAERQSDARAILLDLKQKIRLVEDPKERRNIMRSTFQSLKRSQLAIVDAQLRRGIDLPAAFTPAEQQEMRQGIADARAKLTELGEDLEVWYKPETWSPETKQRMVALGWGAGIGIGVIALALLWRAARKKTAEVAKATGEKVGWLWGKVKWIIGLSLAGGLGYIGIRSYQEFMKLTALRNQLDAVAKKAAAATGKAKEVLENEAQNLKAVIAALETRGAQALAEQSVVAPTTETVKETGRKAVAAVQEKAEEVAEDPRTKEVIEKTKEMTKEQLIARVILAQSREEWDLAPEAKENQVIGLLSNNGNKKMEELENAIDLPFVIPENTEDKPNRIRSGIILLDHCHRTRETVVEKIVHERNCDRSEAETIIGRLSLIDYLEYAVCSSNMYIKTMEELSKIPKSLEEFSAGLQNIPFERILNDEAVKETLLDVMSEIRPEDIGISQEELENVDITSVLMAALSLNQGPLVNVQKSLQAKQDRKEASAEESILLGILKRIASDTNSTHRVMLPLFHGVFPDNSPTKTPEEQVRTYLLDRMTTAEALRFYMYHRMLSQGNALILPLMQMEVIRFIARHDNSFFPGSKKYEAIAGMTGDLATNGGQRIIDEWHRLGLPDLNIELTDGEKQAIILMGKHLALAPAAGAWESFLASLGTYKKYPALFIKGAFSAGAVKMATTRAPFIKYLYRHFTDPTAFSKLLKTLPDTAGPLDVPTRVASTLRSMRPFSYLVYTHAEMTEAQHAYHMIFEGIQKMPHKDTATKLLRHCIANPRIASRWQALAFELDTFNTDIANEARKLAAKSGSRLRGALSALRLPLTLKSGGFIRSVATLPVRAAAVAIDRPLMKGIELSERAYDAIKGSPYFADVMKRLKVVPDVFLKALQSINFSPQLAALFAKSKGGMYLLVNAFVKAGTPALSYIAKLGGFLPLARLAGPLGMVGLEGLLLAIETASIRAEIEKTDSPELKELYEARTSIATIGAGVSTATGIAISVGSKAALPLLPIWATYEAASAARRHFEEATIEWMKTDKDMLRNVPGALLSQLGEIDVGKQRYKDQNAARGDSIFSGSFLEQLTLRGNGEERYAKVEQANTGQRAKITRAYLANTSTVAPQEHENEKSLAYKERVARSLLAQEQYIADATDKTFGSVANETYYNAQDHAELKEMSTALQQGAESSYLPLLFLNGVGNIEQGEEFDLVDYNDLPARGQNKNGVSRGNVLFSYRQQKRAMTLAMAAIIAETRSGSRTAAKEQDALLQQRLLTDVRHDLSRFEQRLLSTDPAGWGWTGGEEKTRSRMRFALSTELKKMLSEESEKLRTNPKAELADINGSIAKLQQFLAQDMSVFVKLAEQADIVTGFTAFSAGERPSTVLTDWKVLLQEITPPPSATHAPMGLAA